MAAGAAQAQVHPRRAQLEALLAAARARLHGADRFEMAAGLAHGVLLVGRSAAPSIIWAADRSPPDRHARRRRPARPRPPRPRPAWSSPRARRRSRTRRARSSP